MAHPPTRPDNTTCRRLFQIACLLLAAVPFAILVGVTARYYFCYPWTDEWALVSLAEKASLGTLTWQDLWASYNNHRLLFPYLIMLPTILLTHWNSAYLVAFNIAISVAIFAMLLRMMSRSLRALGYPFSYIQVLVVALIVFSLNQSFNWLTGWEIQHYLAVASACAGLLLLSSPKINATRFTAAIGLGIVTQYSIAYGTAFWFAGLPILLISLFDQKGARKGHLLTWCLAATTATALFALETRLPTTGPINPGRILTAIPIHIGANLAQFRPRAAFPIGLAALLFTTWASIGLWRAQRVPHWILAPFLSLIAFEIGAAALIGLGHANESSSIIQDCRFCTVSAPFWVTVVFLLHLTAQKEPLGAGWLWQNPMRRWMAIAAQLLIIGCSILSSRQGYYNIREHDAFYTPLVRQLVTERSTELPPRLQYFYGNTRSHELQFLRDNQWSLYRPETVQYFRGQVRQTQPHNKTE